MGPSKKYNGVDKTQSDIIKNQDLIIELLTKLDQAVNTSDSFVTVNRTDADGNDVSTQIPSVSYLTNKIDSLSKTLKKVTGYDGYPSTILFDKNGKFMFSIDINEEPYRISELSKITTFNARPNWIFDSMMNPTINVEIGLNDKIGENTKKIISKRFIIEFETMVNITQDGFRSEVLTQNGQLRLDEFNDLYNGNSNININDFILWLERDGLKNKSNEYLIDDDHFEIEPLNIQSKGVFNILGTEIDVVNNKLWYIFQSLDYFDLTNGYGNEAIIQLKPGIELAVNNPNGTSATVYKVVEISTITSQYRVRLERVFGDEPVPILNAGLRINSKAILDKKVNISVGFDEYSVLFIKPLNDISHIQSVEWSPGIGFYTNELRLNNSSGELLTDFYTNKVYDYGLILEELTEKKIPVFYGIQPNPPLLIEENFTVVQTNTHLTNTTEAETIRDLHNNKIDLVSQISAIQNKIEKKSAVISKVNFSTESEKKAEQEALAKLTQTLITKTISKNTIIAEILANKKNINNIKPTYSVRGIFPFPKAVMDKDGKTKPQEVVQFEIWYKKLSKSGDENQLQTFKDISKDVPLNNNLNLTSKDKEQQNNTKNVNATFSNWIKYKTDGRRQVFNSENGEYEWEVEDIADANTPTINQVDIPIEPGEVIQIKIKSLSEVGYPEAPLESDFSNIITVPFPDNLNSIINDDDFILNDATADNTKSEMVKELETMGLTKHLSSQIRDVDVYYAHSTNAIASGFKDNNGKIINLYDYLLSLRNELIAIKEDVNRSKGILEMYLLYKNTKKRIFNADNLTLNIQLEDYMTKTQIGVAGSPVSSIARTYKNEIIKISDYAIEIRNAAESAILGLLSNRGYGRPSGLYETAFAYKDQNTSQILYVNQEDEILFGKINIPASAYDNFPKVNSQSDNSFIWQYCESMEGRALSKSGTKLKDQTYDIIITEDINLSSSAISAVTSQYHNIGNLGNSLIATVNETTHNVITNERIFTYANLPKDAQTPVSLASLGTSIHATINNITDLTDSSQQKIKYLAAGDNGVINIPISIYTKPFTASKNIGGSLGTEINLTGGIIQTEFMNGGDINIKILNTTIYNLLDGLSPAQIKGTRIILNELNSGEPSFNDKINNKILYIDSINTPNEIKIKYDIPQTVTNKKCNVAQIHILNTNTNSSVGGGNGSKPMKCYNVYNVSSNLSVVDSYVEITSGSVPIEHTKSLRFSMEDETNIRPIDFQLNWKITQHKRASYTIGTSIPSLPGVFVG